MCPSKKLEEEEKVPCDFLSSPRSSSYELPLEQGEL
jgi:hypothetical protein